MEKPVRDGVPLVRPAYSYWTVAYALRRSGAQKLLRTQPLSRLLPVDEYLPIMYGAHPNGEWSRALLRTDDTVGTEECESTDCVQRRQSELLVALAAEPPLVWPAHVAGAGKESYSTDTENSSIWILY